MSKYIKTEVTSENLAELKPYIDASEYNTLCQLLPAIDEGGWIFELQDYDYISQYTDSVAVAVYKDKQSLSGYAVITNNYDGDEYFTDQYLGKEKWSNIIK